MINYVLAHENMYSLITAVTIHDEDDITTECDQNPITTELSTRVSKTEKLTERQGGWKFTEDSLERFIFMAEEQVKFSNEIEKSLAYDAFENQLTTVASKTAGISPKYLKAH